MRRLLPLLLLLTACGGGAATGSSGDADGPTARLEPATGTQIARLVAVVLDGDQRYSEEVGIAKYE